MGRDKRNSAHKLVDDMGILIQNVTLIEQALTHSSLANTNNARGITSSAISNERLEFLGDTVLNLVITTHIFTNLAHFHEGELSKIRSKIIDEETLAGVARRWQLGRYLMMSKGEERGGGRERSSLLADALEALLGAVYIDLGFDGAKNFIHKIFAEELEKPLEIYLEPDYKSKLQELMQEKYKDLPQYETEHFYGPGHALQFDVVVSFRGKRLANGRGFSKKKASQQAAQKALERIEQQPFLLNEAH